MRRMSALVLVAAAVAFIARPVSAQTLEQALVEAYENNPTLNAERARLRATNERVPQALSGYRPTVSANIQAGRRWIDSNQEAITGQQDDALFTRRYGATIEQPLYRGGQTVAAVRGAENTVRSERARLESVEQTVVLDAATAYSDVYRDQAVLELTIRNEQRLMRQMEAARDRFQVGEVTRTDVSQAEARLARSIAERIRAEGELARSRAVFRNVVGRMPAVLPRPPLPEGLPANLSDANAIALDWNPDVTAAAFQERSALDGVDQVKGE
ncbi:MAG TPA: TolC family protein, partial [Rhodospirillales bacterium]|nr:TolC family protein [Rhodospirillales bacterium]